MKCKLSHLITAGILLLAATSCKKKVSEPAPDINLASGIVGLASPIQLEYDTTYIYLLDYFEDAAGLDTVTMADSANFSFIADSAIIVVNEFEAHRGVSAISVVYKGVAYQIPVFRSRSAAFNFSEEDAANDAVTG